MANVGSSSVLGSFFDNPRLRGALFQGRYLLALLLLAGLAAMMQPRWLPVAFALSLFGELIQAWCFGSLVKNEEVTVRGPYALVRNPMYLGRFFTFLGFVVLLGNPIVIAVYTVLYYLYMFHRVRREEVRLRGWLGERYDSYCREVRRFLPAPGRLGKPEVWFFDWRTFVANHAHWNLLSTLGAYLVLLLVAWLVPR